MIGYFLILQSVVILWLLIQLGRTTGGLKKRIDRASRHLELTDKPKEPKAICGCEHHHCFHDEEGGGCDHTSLIKAFDAFGIEHHKAVRCKCKRYTGPVPLPTVIP
jgi:hypothetical protein